MQSSQILRILRISEKYNERPSKVMGIENTAEAFKFDEACMYILSNKSTREVTRNGKQYIEEYWINKPKWNDVIEEKRTNNSELIAAMQENLKKYKK